LAVAEPPKTFHCTPSSRLALRSTSMKRTSSMTCCCCITRTVSIASLSNWRAISIALSSVAASGAVPLSMMWLPTDVILIPPPVNCAISAASPERSYDTLTSKICTGWRSRS
jgi:hypothetical protein